LICVYRDTAPDRFEVYRAPLEEQLPNIPIPLRAGERDIVLQLQPLIDACYHDGRYYRINYQADPQPAFDDEHARWIAAQLRSQGRRGCSIRGVPASTALRKCNELRPGRAF
jgi:hypothetical protein